MEKKTYFEIKMDCEGVALILPLEEAKTILDEMEDGETGEIYSFKSIEMTEKECKELPGFTGF